MFRRELAVSRERKRRSGHPLTRLLIAVTAFVVVLLGIRKSTAG